jgi:hypothetical protein
VFSRFLAFLAFLTCLAFSAFSVLSRTLNLESDLKGLSYKIYFKNVDKNLQILAFIRAGAGF